MEQRTEIKTQKYAFVRIAKLISISPILTIIARFSFMKFATIGIEGKIKFVITTKKIRNNHEDRALQRDIVLSISFSSSERTEESMILIFLISATTTRNIAQINPAITPVKYTKPGKSK